MCTLVVYQRYLILGRDCTRLVYIGGCLIASESFCTTDSCDCCNAANAMFCSIVGRRLTSVVTRGGSMRIAEPEVRRRAVSGGVGGRDCEVSISSPSVDDVLPVEE